MRLLNITAGTLLAAVAAVQPANADRVCRQECVGPVCQEKCVEVEDRTEGRGIRRDREELIEEREERRERRPGIELNIPVPDVDVRIGR
ncbi:MAG: hypothetical protein QOC56_2513 [Alphaproteobacteria bacterium]|nr:hypothetical protein [Alphaproteobacteria bacterium]